MLLFEYYADGLFQGKVEGKVEDARVNFLLMENILLKKYQNYCKYLPKHLPKSYIK